jgi:hypothetical protein
MDITLTHQFLFRSTPNQGRWAELLLKDVVTLGQLETNLQKIAFPKDEADLFGHNPLADVLGDGWEFFNEILMKTFSYVPSFDFHDIIVTPPGTIGVDMTGKGRRGQPKTEQSKYMGIGKKPWVTELKAGEDMRLERFAYQSHANPIYGVNQNDTDSMIVITNAKGLDYFTENDLLCEKVQCIGRPLIEEFVNDNSAFWEHARYQAMRSNPNIKF